MSATADVLIIGGGVIGLTTAYDLAQAGVAVTVLDQGDFGRQSSWAGAGILTPATTTAHTPLEQLRSLSLRLFPELSRRLREETGLDNGYLVCGALEILDRGDVDDEEWRSPGVRMREIGAEEMHALEPRLNPTCRHAYHLPDVGQVRNPWHVQALLEACRRRGVRLLAHQGVRALLRREARVEGVVTDQGPLAAGKVLLTAGAWTAELLEPLGWRPGIKPIRGQIALFNTGEPGIRPLLLLGRRYLVPRADGRILAGSTEEDVGFAAHPTGEGIGELLAFALDLVPELARVPLERCWAGLRPGSPDGLPFLGPVPDCANLFVAAGHFRSGILLSPGTAAVMSRLLREQPLPFALEAFRLDRQTPFRPDRH